MSFFLSVLLTASLVSAQDVLHGRDASNSASLNLSRPASSSSTSIRSSASSTSSSSKQENIGGFIASGIGVSPEATSSSSTIISLSPSPIASSSSIIASSSSPFNEHVSSTIAHSSATPSSTTHSTLTIVQTQTQTRVSSVIRTGSPASISGTRSGSQISLSGNVTAFQTPTSTLWFHINGTGSLASCQNARWSWYFYSSMAAVSSGSYSVTTKTTFWTASGVPQVTQLANIAGVTSQTTLCDGYARQIGESTTQPTSTFVTNSSTTITMVQSIPNYPTTPCSIAPSDCSSLWSSYLNPTTTLADPMDDYPPPPPCPTGNATTFDWEANRRKGQFMMVAAQMAQLFYWPVQLADPAALHANSSQNAFCHEQYDGWVDPGLNVSQPTHTLRATLPGTRTGAGPNTAVVSGITITSPTVAIAFSRLKADHTDLVFDTVVTMAPDQVMTYRANGGDSIPHPIEYEQLNWVCQDKSKPNATYTTQDSQGENCYQNVAAAAYFNNGARFFAYRSWLESSNRTQITILNDYAPRIAPASVVSSLIHSIWGPGAIWDWRGVWDPPSALSSDNSIIAPTVAGSTPTSAQALSAVTTSAQIQQTATPPAPATSPMIPPLTTSTQAQHSTQATSELPPPPMPTVVSVSSNNPAPNNQQNSSPSDPGNSKPNDPGNSKPNDPSPSPSTQQPATPNTQQPTTQNTQKPATSAQTQTSNPFGVVVVESGAAASAPGAQTSQQVVAAQPTVISIGNTALTAINSGSNIVVGSATLAPGAATTIAGQQVSNPSQGNSAIVVGTGTVVSTVAVPASATQPAVISIGNTALTVVNSGSNIVVGSATLAPGAATTIAGQQISNPSQGNTAIIVGTGAIVSTVAIPAPAPSASLSISSISSGVVAVNGQTLTAGGSAQTIGGQQVSLGAAGVVVSSANTPTTIPVVSVPLQVTVGSSVIAVSSLSSGVAVVGSQTLSVGGQPGSLNGQQLSVASQGLVIGTGSTAQTIPLSTASVVTINSQTLTRSMASGGVEVLSNGQTAITLTPGSSGVTIGGQVVSAATGGLVVSSVGAATTLSISPGGSNSQTSSTTSNGNIPAGNGTTSTRASGATSGSAAASLGSPGSGSSRSIEVGGPALAITLLSFIMTLRYAI